MVIADAVQTLMMYQLHPTHTTTHWVMLLLLLLVLLLMLLKVPNFLQYKKANNAITAATDKISRSQLEELIIKLVPTTFYN